jgi:hypothetical protein
LPDDFDPEVEWVEGLRYPGAETFHGPAGVERSLKKWWDAWSEITVQLVEVIDLRIESWSRVMPTLAGMGAPGKVRRLFVGRRNRRDLPGSLEGIHPDAELHPSATAVESSAYRGPEGARKFLRTPTTS